MKRGKVLPVLVLTRGWGEVTQSSPGTGYPFPGLSATDASFV